MRGRADSISRENPIRTLAFAAAITVLLTLAARGSDAATIGGTATYEPQPGQTVAVTFRWTFDEAAPDLDPDPARGEWHYADPLEFKWITTDAGASLSFANVCASAIATRESQSLITVRGLDCTGDGGYSHMDLVLMDATGLYLGTDVNRMPTAADLTSPDAIAAGVLNVGHPFPLTTVTRDVYAVPEAAVTSLLAGGLLGMGIVGRRTT